MGHSLKTVPPEFESLPVEERIRYVQDLRDYITNDSLSIPVPEEHKRILDERLKDYRKNPDSGRSWGDFSDAFTFEALTFGVSEIGASSIDFSNCLSKP